MSNAPPPSRSAQAALAGLAVLVAGWVAVRGYSDRFTTRPTDAIGRPATAIDLNTADRTELLTLPGVGPSLADAILAHRSTRGRFDAVDELTDVHGVGDRTLATLRPWLTVGDRNPVVVRAAEPQVETLARKPVVPPPPAKTGKLAAGDPPLDLNAATEADLQRLPGVGPVLAGRIAAYRATAPFRAVEDLRKVKGIGAKTLDAIRPFVVVR